MDLDASIEAFESVNEFLALFNVLLKTCQQLFIIIFLTTRLEKCFKK
jgi:hypothetical protein